jgi:hypothetical protein
MTKKEPLEFDPETGWPLCDKCAEKIDYGLIGAAASVGIEHGKSTSAMIHKYLSEYHVKGHKDA